MKAFLMHPDQDFDLQRDLAPHQDALTRDLELETLFGAMAGSDQFLYEVAKRAVLSSLKDPETISYRQQVLGDCLQQPQVVRELYGIAVEAIQRERKIWGVFMNSPDTILHHSIQILELFVSILKRLRTFADRQAGSFQSEGFRRLFAMLATELDDDYFRTVEAHLQETATRTGSRPWRNSAPGESTRSPTPWPNPPITSSASSPCCGPNSASTSDASTCTSG
jgi:hypothetical protein